MIKNYVSQINPKFNKTLDSRLYVSSIAERNLLSNRYWGMIVTDSVTKIEYQLIDNWSWNLLDNTNWTSLSTTEQQIIPAINELLSIIPSVVDVTYAELQTLISTSALIPWNKYKLTDYQTIGKFANVQEYFQWAVEELVITAIDINKIDNKVESVSRPNDEIYYDYTNNIIYWADLYSEWYTWASSWDFTTSNVTSNTFTVDLLPAFDGGGEIYWEDYYGSSFTIDSSSIIWVDYLLTNLWGGEYQFQVLNFAPWYKYSENDNGTQIWNFNINFTWPTKITIDYDIIWVNPLSRNANASDWVNSVYVDNGSTAWVNYNYTDLWWWVFEIEFLDEPLLDLTWPSFYSRVQWRADALFLDSLDYSYIYSEFSTALASRPWIITRRIDTERNIDTDFDFVEQKTRLYKPDMTWLSYDPLNNYKWYDIVNLNAQNFVNTPTEFNWDIYVNNSTTNNSLDPSSWATRQSTVFNINTNSLFDFNWLSIWWVFIPALAVDYIDEFVFNPWNTYSNVKITWTTTFDNWAIIFISWSNNINIDGTSSTYLESCTDVSIKWGNWIYMYNSNNIKLSWAITSIFNGCSIMDINTIYSSILTSSGYITWNSLINIRLNSCANFSFSNNDIYIYVSGWNSFTFGNNNSWIFLFSNDSSRQKINFRFWEQCYNIFLRSLNSTSFSNTFESECSNMMIDVQGGFNSNYFGLYSRWFDIVQPTESFAWNIFTRQWGWAQWWYWARFRASASRIEANTFGYKSGWYFNITWSSGIYYNNFWDVNQQFFFWPWGYGFSYNTFWTWSVNNTFYLSTFAFEKNSFPTRLSQCTFTDCYFSDNIFLWETTNCYFANGYMRQNTSLLTISDLTVNWSDLRFNIFEWDHNLLTFSGGWVVQKNRFCIRFSNATFTFGPSVQVFSDHHCEIKQGSNSSYYLEYFDWLTPVYVLPTA